MNEHSLALRPPANLRAEQRARRREYLRHYGEVTGKVLLCPEMMGRRERAATPLGFRDLLLSMARSAVRRG